jgi:homoserine O-succinyltransferase
MPIILLEALPAAAQLRQEGIAVLAPSDAPARVLNIGLVNLMPDKPTTETQLARLLGAAPQVPRLSLFWPQGENSRRTPPEHLAFYEPIESADMRALDALIITGAPVEQKPFAEVRYWPQLAALYDAAREAGVPTLNICWAAMAALHHHRGLAKRMLAAKAFGVFDQAVREPAHALMQGMPATFPMPVSRHAHVPLKVLTGAGIAVLASSGETGASIAHDAENNATLLFDHIEYDAGTLLAEFLRDRQAARPPRRLPAWHWAVVRPCPGGRPRTCCSAIGWSRSSAGPRRAVRATCWTGCWHPASGRAAAPPWWRSPRLVPG